jgi:hypothetical protein
MAKKNAKRAKWKPAGWKTKKAKRKQKVPAKRAASLSHDWSVCVGYETRARDLETVEIKLDKIAQRVWDLAGVWPKEDMYLYAWRCKTRKSAVDLAGKFLELAKGRRVQGRFEVTVRRS